MNAKGKSRISRNSAMFLLKCPCFIRIVIIIVLIPIVISLMLGPALYIVLRCGWEFRNGVYVFVAIAFVLKAVGDDSFLGRYFIEYIRFWRKIARDILCYGYELLVYKIELLSNLVF